jgi:hypothetical protein
MTYPPQQPPGPYDPNQNPYGQQPGWQQQPPPQPGYDAYGPQQPHGYDAYGPQQPYPQQQPYPTQPYDPYAYQGGYGQYPQPPQKKTGMLVALAVAGVVVVGGGITTVALLSGDSSSPDTTNLANGTTAGTAEELVTQAMKAIDAKDANAANALMCDPNRASITSELSKVPPDITIRSRQDTDTRHSGSTATAKLDLLVTRQNGSSAGAPLTLTLRMTEKQPGKWCVDRASMDQSVSTARRPPSTRPTS